jgi:O-acetyl-ADP-ribose deacetylase (regulator of RNase III)
MTIEAGHGDLITAKVDALINPVNTEGVMGKGLALQFKKAFPDVFVEYASACRRGEVVIGRMHVVQRSAAPRFVINFPTKQQWRNPSKLEYVDAGLVDLIAHIHHLGIESIAIPPLGCGLGGLDWTDVKPRLVQAFASLPDVRVVLFEPGGTR